MKKKKQVIFVPGFGGVEGGGWPFWLGKELVKAGFEFNLLPMPGIMYPEVNEWLDFIKAQKIKITKDTYFVGHSLGCITIARYFASLPKKITIPGCVFVAGFCSLPKVPMMEKFCTLPLDFSSVKNHAREFVVVISSNDHLIPRADSQEFAEKLGARIIEEQKKGHFMSDVKELHSVLNIILEMDQMKEEEGEIKKLKKLKA